MQAPDDQDARARARRQAEARYSFRIDAAAYVLVNALLIGVWYFGPVRFPWFLFVLAGWGIGLAFHYAKAYGSQEGDWVDRETQKILDNEKK